MTYTVDKAGMEDSCVPTNLVLMLLIELPNSFGSVSLLIALAIIRTHTTLRKHFTGRVHRRKLGRIVALDLLFHLTQFEVIPVILIKYVRRRVVATNGTIRAEENQPLDCLSASAYVLSESLH